MDDILQNFIIMFIWNPRWPPPQDKFDIGAYVKINVVHLTGIVLYWTSVKCMFFLMIGFPKWLPQQNIGPLWENKHFMTVIYALILIDWLIDWFLVFSATFSNISAISWRPVLVVEEAGENHRPWASNW